LREDVESDESIVLKGHGLSRAASQPKKSWPLGPEGWGRKWKKHPLAAKADTHLKLFSGTAKQAAEEGGISGEKPGEHPSGAKARH
jgi:hypothetical protein